MRVSTLLSTVGLAVSLTSAHYTFPGLITGSSVSGAWVNTRKTNNYNTRGPVLDVTSPDLRCYTSETKATAETAPVTAGEEIGFTVDDPTGIYHAGTVNVYMAKATDSAASFDGDGDVWFKVHEIPAVTDGGTTITFPAEGITEVKFTLPKNLPNGEYLVRLEAIALHSASSFGGAQFYIACAQVAVSGGGSGTPGPLVAIPGVYTGNEPGILVNIYYPIPTEYIQPGPAVWSG